MAGLMGAWAGEEEEWGTASQGRARDPGHHPGRLPGSSGWCAKGVCVADVAPKITGAAKGGLES